MTSLSRYARVAGLFYLTLLTAPLRLIYIPSKLFVAGNASATANNIAAHETLFRLGMVSDVQAPEESLKNGDLIRDRSFLSWVGCLSAPFFYVTVYRIHWFPRSVSINTSEYFPVAWLHSDAARPLNTSAFIGTNPTDN
jgi:hypothetical protein